MTVDHKPCSSCGIPKPHTAEHFVPNRGCKNGLSGCCRDCKNAYHRRWKVEHPEHAARAREKDRGAARIRAAAWNRIRSAQRPYLDRANILRQGIRTRHRKNAIPADLDFFTVRFLLAWLIRQPWCECCAVPFAMGRKFDGKKVDASPSLDRIVPALGYTEGNVALLCWRCNNLKRDATADELARVADWLRKRTCIVAANAAE